MSKKKIVLEGEAARFIRAFELSGFSQIKDFCSAVGVHPSFFSQIKSGKKKGERTLPQVRHKYEPYLEQGGSELQGCESIMSEESLTKYTQVLEKLIAAKERIEQLEKELAKKEEDEEPLRPRNNHT